MTPFLPALSPGNQLQTPGLLISLRANDSWSFREWGGQHGCDCWLETNTSRGWGAGEVPFHDPMTSCLLYNDLYAAGGILGTFLYCVLVHNKIVWKLKQEAISLLSVAHWVTGGERACGDRCWDRGSGNGASGQRRRTGASGAD